MNEDKFNIFMKYAKFLENNYGAGYMRGLRRHYHGEAFGTEQEHQKWIALDGQRSALGEGYRDGFEGKAPRGLHGNTGNSYATKGDLPLDSFLKCRVNSQQKEAFVNQAKKEDMSLSAWVIHKLTSALV